MTVQRLLVRALNAAGAERPRQVERLALAVDDVKFMLQLGQEPRAFFHSFRQFEAIAALAETAGTVGATATLGRRGGRAATPRAARHWFLPQPLFPHQPTSGGLP